MKKRTAKRNPAGQLAGYDSVDSGKPTIFFPLHMAIVLAFKSPPPK